MAIMKFSPAKAKPPELSDREKATLQEVASGETVEPFRCERLRALGLVVQTHRRWALTQQGHIRLMFQGAR
jgi:hypothetical protein